METFDCLNGLSSIILLTFSSYMYFDNPQMAFEQKLSAQFKCPVYARPPCPPPPPPSSLTLIGALQQYYIFCFFLLSKTNTSQKRNCGDSMKTRTTVFGSHELTYTMCRFIYTVRIVDKHATFSLFARYSIFSKKICLFN